MLMYAMYNSILAKQAPCLLHLYYYICIRYCQVTILKPIKYNQLRKGDGPMPLLKVTSTETGSMFVQRLDKLRNVLLELVERFNMEQEVGADTGTVHFHFRSPYEAPEIRLLLWKKGFDVEVEETPTRECDHESPTMAA